MPYLLQDRQQLLVPVEDDCVPLLVHWVVAAPHLGVGFRAGWQHKQDTYERGACRGVSAWVLAFKLPLWLPAATTVGQHLQSSNHRAGNRPAQLPYPNSCLSVEPKLAMLLTLSTCVPMSSQTMPNTAAKVSRPSM